MEEKALHTMMFLMETLFVSSAMGRKIKRGEAANIPLDKRVLNKLTGEENIFTVSIFLVCFHYQVSWGFIRGKFNSRIILNTYKRLDTELNEIDNYFLASGFSHPNHSQIRSDTSGNCQSVYQLKTQNRNSRFGERTVSRSKR